MYNWDYFTQIKRMIFSMKMKASSRSFLMSDWNRLSIFYREVWVQIPPRAVPRSIRADREVYGCTPIDLKNLTEEWKWKMKNK